MLIDRPLWQIQGSGDGLYASAERVLFALHEGAHAVTCLATGGTVERVALPRHGGSYVGSGRTVYGETLYGDFLSDAEQLIVTAAGRFGEELAHPEIRAGIPAFRAEDEQAIRTVLNRLGLKWDCDTRKHSEQIARKLVQTYRDEIDAVAFDLLMRAELSGSWVQMKAPRAAMHKARQRMAYA